MGDVALWMETHVLMTRASWIATLWILQLVLVSATCANYANAQSTPKADSSSPSSTESAVDTLKTIDQLVEQNRKLEQQNQELMNQLQKLRAAIAQQARREPDSPTNAGAKPGAANAGAAPPDEGITATTDTKNTASARSDSTPPSGSAQTSTAAQSSSQNPSEG